MQKTVIVVFVTCLLLLSACSGASSETSADKPSHNTYDSFIVDMANDGIITDVEKDWWLGYSTIQDVDEHTKIVEVNGKEHTVTYLISMSQKYSDVPLDRFYDDELYIEYSSLDGTFRCVNYHSLIDDDYYMSNDIEDPYENAYKMAMQIASQYISISDYTLIENQREFTSKDLPRFTEYSFQFLKFVGEYETTDYLNIYITSKGDVRILDIRDIGRYDTIQSSLIDNSAVDASVVAKLDELYGKDGTYTYEICRQTLTYTPEGELAVASVIDLEIKRNTGSDISTAIILATIVDTEGSNYSTTFVN